MEHVPVPRWAKGLQTQVFAHPLYTMASVDSTNQEILRLARAGAAEGAVVLAEEQTGGHGRSGRAWASPGGLGIWMSLLLLPPMREAPFVTQVACAAVARALSALGAKVRIKWPNDVFLPGGKVCGILAESEISGGICRTALGIGININQHAADFPALARNTPCSLRMALGGIVARDAVFRSVLETFEPLYLRWKHTGEKRETLRICREASCVLGKRVEIAENGVRQSVVAVALDENGGLTVRGADGRERTLYAGEVSVRVGE